VTSNDPAGMPPCRVALCLAGRSLRTGSDEAPGAASWSRARLASHGRDGARERSA